MLVLEEHVDRRVDAFPQLGSSAAETEKARSLGDQVLTLQMKLPLEDDFRQLADLFERDEFGFPRNAFTLPEIA